MTEHWKNYIFFSLFCAWLLRKLSTGLNVSANGCLCLCGPGMKWHLSRVWPRLHPKTDGIGSSNPSATQSAGAVAVQNGWMLAGLCFTPFCWAACQTLSVDFYCLHGQELSWTELTRLNLNRLLEWLWCFGFAFNVSDQILCICNDVMRHNEFLRFLPRQIVKVMSEQTK